MGETGVIILAGGLSIRFGQPKPFLHFDESFSFLQKLLSVYSEFGIDHTIIVSNSELKDELEKMFTKHDRANPTVILNYYPERGRFYSIKLGAQAATELELCFIQNVDNPFTDIETLNRLYQNAEERSYISPVYDGKGGHPILIPKEILESIRDEKDFTISAKDFFMRFKRTRVEVTNRNVLANINTPEDYLAYFKDLV